MRTDVAGLTSELEVRVDTYDLPGVGAHPHLELLGVAERDRSTLVRYRIRGPAGMAALLAKIPYPVARRRPSTNDRPRLISEVMTDDKYALEFRALRRVEEHLARLGDSRFGAVRAVDVVLEHHAIVMLEAPGRPLSRLLLSVLGPGNGRRSRDLEVAFRNAGAWLRAYHGMDDEAALRGLQTRPGHFVELLDAYTSYLAAHDVNPLSENLLDEVRQSAASVLPDPLPIGLRHGDFAMRNILVEPGGRVAVLDMLAKSYAPIYEDVAKLLNALHTNRAQVLSQGRAFARETLEGFERAYLAGYFEDDEVPLPAVRLYQLLVLLDKWAAQVAERRGRSPIRAALSRLLDRYYRARAGTVLAQVAAG